MKGLSLVAASARVAWSVLGVACAWHTAASVARAQELSVVERSPEDRESADKLSELLREPVTRLHAQSAGARGADTAGCTGDVKRTLILDSALRVVRLVRCRDGTTLSRTLDPLAAARTPYLGAFIAAELLAIDRELEAVEARAPAAVGGRPERRGRGGTDSPGASAEPNATSANNAVARSDSDSANSADSRNVAAVAASGEARSSSTKFAADSGEDRGDATTAIPIRAAPIALRLSAGAELNAVGAPFPGAVRPSLALGVALQPAAAGPRWVVELFASAFGSGQATRDAERLSMRRSDGQLRLAGLYPLLGGRLELGGFAFLRGALTSVRYTGVSQVESSQLRWGLGAGVLASLALAGPFQLYAHGLVDFATSRSEYRVMGATWLKDPARLVWVGAGLLVHFAP